MLWTNGDNSSDIVDTSDSTAQPAGNQVHCSTSIPETTSISLVANRMPPTTNSPFLNAPSVVTSQTNFNGTSTSSSCFSGTGDGRSQAAPAGASVFGATLPSTSEASAQRLVSSLCFSVSTFARCTALVGEV